MSVMSLQRSSCTRVASSRTTVPRVATSFNRRSAVRVVAFRDDDRIGSKLNKTANKVANKASKAANQVSSKTNKAANQVSSKAKQAANQSGRGSSSRGSSKQRTVLPPRAPRNERENSESVVAFVAVASLFLTGVLFVFPALLGGAPATTKPIQTGINKTFGIKEPADNAGPSYAPGPGPAAAPGSPATRM